MGSRMKYQVGDYVQIKCQIYSSTIIQGYVLCVTPDGDIRNITVEEGTIHHDNFHSHRFHNLYPSDEIEFIRRSKDIFEILKFQSLKQNLINRQLIYDDE